ncbi:MAG: PD-(D/E)XK nuclease domain-containing protein [Lachnospiraceae bacterium]|nr:PD-(D/E)XK nuclease domain-containing protein [Lachnospiraceae bacterium]
MFRLMIHRWFSPGRKYNEFLKALLDGDVESMNKYMNEVSYAVFSTFDTGKKPSGKAAPEKFYHGFVLGLMVDLRNRYVIASNRESGYGRYDVMLKPKEGGLPAIILEFKVHDPADGGDLDTTVLTALKQIEDKKYTAAFVAEGIREEHIREYGFAFEGKTVRIGGGDLKKVDSMIKAVGRLPEKQQ